MNSRSTLGHLRFALITFASIVFATSLASCELINDVATAMDPPPRLPSIDGPEDSHLLDDVHGTLVWSDRDDPAQTISLPHFEKLRFQVDSALVSGPAANGLVLYRRRETSKQDVRWRSLSSGSESILIEKVPAAIFFSMVLSASGERAFVSWGDLQSPCGALVWNSRTGARRELAGLLVRNASWLPDGVHVIVESWIRESEGRGVPPVELANSWDEVGLIIDPRVNDGEPKLWPSLQVLDTASGKTEWIAWGRDPLVSPDGKRLLYEWTPRLPLHLRDMESGTERTLELPGLLRQRHWPEGEEGDSRLDGSVYQWLSNRILLYDALPTEGQDPGYVSKLDLQTNHPKWTIKAADVDSLAFKTVIDSVDGAWCSFGPFELH